MGILTLKSSPEAWKLLNGIVCIYKETNVSRNSMLKSLKQKICDDLNAMKTRPPQTHVEIRKLKSGEETPKEAGKRIISVLHDGSGDRVEVVEGPSYADHPFVIGPRHQPIDIASRFANILSPRTSGVLVLGVNGGMRTAERIYHSRWLREFRVSGVFGAGTHSFFTDGRILEKATYHKIKRTMLERLLAKSQSSHQLMMFKSLGIPLDSQRAYDLASKGLLRPDETTDPIVYSLKLIEFEPPNFEIEVKVINENEQYFGTLIHELALKLNTVAACSKIRCTKFGPFELKHTLLRKHFGLGSVLNNMQTTANILHDFNMNVRDPLLRISTGSEATPDDNTDDNYENEVEEAEMNSEKNDDVVESNDTLTFGR